MQVEVPEDLAQDLLQAADQYLLEGLKRLCEEAISESITIDSLVNVYDLSEAYSAPQLGTRCVLFALERCDDLVSKFGIDKYLGLMERMVPRLRTWLNEQLLKTEDDDGQVHEDEK